MVTEKKYSETKYVVIVKHDHSFGYLSKRYYKNKHKKRVGGYRKYKNINTEVITPSLKYAARFNDKESIIRQMEYLNIEIDEIKKIHHRIEILE